MMNKKSGINQTTLGEKITIFVIYAIITLLTLTILFPLINVVTTSFVSQAEYSRRGSFILIPEVWDLTAYQLLLSSGSNIWNGYKNTIFVVFVGTALNMLVTVPMSYALSKRDLKGRAPIMAMILFTMLFSGGMIPNYMLVNSIGLLNTRWSLVLPGLVSAWNMILLRNFFYSIPESLKEAALLDGANQLQVLLKIILPISKASLATITLFYAVGHWNSWFGAYLYINNSKLLPVQNILRNILSSTSALSDLDPSAYAELETVPSTNAMQSATIIVATVPMLMAYPFIQKYFVKGVMVGSVKG